MVIIPDERLCQDQLEQSRESLAARGADVEVYVCDVRRPEQLRAIADQLLQSRGHVDILIANAGVMQVTRICLVRFCTASISGELNLWAARGAHTSHDGHQCARNVLG